MRYDVIAALPLLLLLFTSGTAQSSCDLHQKYGAPVDGKYIVRPHVAASQFYSDQLHACVVKIQSVNVVDLSDEGDLLPPAMAEEVVNELAPVEKRGKYSGTTDTECGRIGEITSIYEKVIVSRHTEGKNRWYSRVNIEWRAEACQ